VRVFLGDNATEDPCPKERRGTIVEGLALEQALQLESNPLAYLILPDRISGRSQHRRYKLVGVENWPEGIAFTAVRDF